MRDILNQNAGKEEIHVDGTVWRAGDLWKLANDMQEELPEMPDHAEVIYHSKCAANPEAVDQRIEQAEHMAWAWHLFNTGKSRLGMYEHIHPHPMSGREDQVIFQPVLGDILENMMENRKNEIDETHSS